MTAARTPEEVLAEHPVMWLGDWPGGTTCGRCGVLDVSTTAHQAQALRDAGLLVTPEHDREVAVGAWDQGAHWGFFSTTYSADNPNPYRADRVRRGEGA